MEFKYIYFHTGLGAATGCLGFLVGTLAALPVLLLPVRGPIGFSIIVLIYVLAEVPAFLVDKRQFRRQRLQAANRQGRSRQDRKPR